MAVAFLLVSSDGWAMGADDYNTNGMNYMRQGEYAKAIDEFSKAIQDDACHIKAYYNRGGAYVALQKYQEALADFDRALVLDPRYVKGYNDRAYVYEKLGKYDEALTDVNQALGIGPAEATFYDTRGVAYAGKKLYPEALKDFRQALQMEPALAKVYVHRAQVYMDTGRWSGALADYNDYIKYARPDDNDPDLILSMRRCNEIVRMLPELEAWDKEKLGLTYQLADGVSGQANTVEWNVTGSVVTLRHLLEYAAEAKLKVVVDRVKRYGEYTLIRIYEQREDCFEPSPAIYTVEASLNLTDPGKYVVQLWGVAHNAPRQSGTLIAEKEINVEEAPERQQPDIH